MSTDYDRLRSSLAAMSPARKELLKRFTGGKEPTLADVVAVRRFVSALAGTIGSMRHAAIRGLGTFDWKPYNCRLPDGRRVSSWRLVFRLCPSARRTER